MEKELDLEHCSRLKKLNTEGSQFSSYIIADGAPLEEFKIERPTSLYLSNLTNLKQRDEEGNLIFNINNYDRLEQIEFNNIDHHDVNSKDIINNINKNKTITYDLRDVNWVFNDLDGITDNEIPLLEFLLKGETIDNKAKALSLSGTATIPFEAYSGSNHLGLYEKYSLYSNNDKTFPNLDLNFMDENNN
jgi:hypothetical protein